MIHAAGHINMRMPHYMVIKISTALNSVKKAINGSRILFLGVAYKPNIDDARESPALEIMDLVAKKGGEVYYHDPFIAEITTNHGRSFNSVALTPKVLAESDCVVITTNHSAFDSEIIRKHTKLIVDLRNVIKDGADNLFKL